MKFNKRTHTNGELRIEHAGEKVVLNGWVNSRRDLGGLIFITLRDRYGITQIVFEPEENSEVYESAKKLRNEFVISVEGVVRARPEDMINKSMATGAVEVTADKLLILNEAETPPFTISDKSEASEELRLKYRYLDLRRSEMQKNLLLRHKMYQIVRKYFDSRNFIEVETPVLMKSTPEGARDYLVPSRIHKGKFYALPQSPQTYKQLLMVAGFDRYFQITKCFRDEDLRADRQPEFTQIDVEMSFVDVEDIFEIVEELMKIMFKEIKDYDIQLPLKRLPYSEAMEKYGSDKPDLRFGMEIVNLYEAVKTSEFRVFKESAQTGIVGGLLAKGCADYSRSKLDGLTKYVKELGAGGLVWMKMKEGVLESPVAKFLTDEEKKNIVEAMEAENGDLILIVSGPKAKSLNVLGALRLEMAKRLELVTSETKPSLLWVTDFPLLEWDEETNRFYAMHHPFTSPKVEDLHLLDNEPGKVRARAYDLVLNGNEIAGGSIRIHSSEVQHKMFEALGIGKDEAEEKFGFLMNAFKYGAPPHGGIAFGFDRMAMLFADKNSIRDMIAFPKTTSALSLMDNAPANVDEAQLKELHIKIRD
jgi:aspartyl-tRNA synthetase